MKIYVSGRDGVGWALDVQRKCLITSLDRLGHRVTPAPLFADAIVTVNWTPLALRRYAFMNFKKTIALASNFIDLDAPDYPERALFGRVNRRVTAWMSPSRKQLDVFRRHGVLAFYQPFYPDDVFLRVGDRPDKRVVCERLGIDYERIRGRVVIASIQRDTEGADLASPKLVKGPDILVEMLRALPDRDRFVVLLSGPRRHYVMSSLREAGVPYVYAGREPAEKEDDLFTNLLPAEMVPLLYQLADIYLVTSRSEGGPKAVIEAAMTRTLVFSTDVGMARDFLVPDCVFNDIAAYRAALTRAVAEFPSERLRDAVEANYRTASTILAPPNMDALLQAAIEGVTR